MQFDTYAKYISCGFADKAEAMEDRTVNGTKCYLCRRNLRKKIRWFTPNGKHYYSVSYCDRHGFMKSKIRMRKSEDKMVYVVKTERFITEPEVEVIREKQKKTIEHKKFQEKAIKNGKI